MLRRVLNEIFDTQLDIQLRAMLRGILNRLFNTKLDAQLRGMLQRLLNGIFDIKLIPSSGMHLLKFQYVPNSTSQVQLQVQRKRPNIIKNNSKMLFVPIITLFVIRPISFLAHWAIVATASPPCAAHAAYHFRPKEKGEKTATQPTCDFYLCKKFTRNQISSIILLKKSSSSLPAR